MNRIMEVCSAYEHEDIVYTGKQCPLCEALEEIKDLEQRVEELETP